MRPNPGDAGPHVARDAAADGRHPAAVCHERHAVCPVLRCAQPDAQPCPLYERTEWPKWPGRPGWHVQSAGGPRRLEQLARRQRQRHQPLPDGPGRITQRQRGSCSIGCSDWRFSRRPICRARSMRNDRHRGHRGRAPWRRRRAGWRSCRERHGAYQRDKKYQRDFERAGH